jgi:hypothetical protein
LRSLTLGFSPHACAMSDRSPFTSGRNIDTPSSLGEPALAIDDFVQTATHGRGMINVLAADQLLQQPKLDTTLLLWLLAELFENLPEVGRPLAFPSRVVSRVRGNDRQPSALGRRQARTLGSCLIRNAAHWVDGQIEMVA